MPMLMEKKDWARTISSFATQDRVWQEDVCGDAGAVSLSLPELGRYRVFLVKIEEKKSPRHSAHDLIGYGRKYCGEPRTSADWLHEIREGGNARSGGKSKRKEPNTVSLFETLRSCPFGGVELNVERDCTAGRQVEFA